jgi:hypothetical protein
MDNDGRGIAVREFVANLPAKRPVLRKAQVMRVGGRATAKLLVTNLTCSDRECDVAQDG